MKTQIPTGPDGPWGFFLCVDGGRCVADFEQALYEIQWRIPSRPPGGTAAIRLSADNG